MSTFGCLIGLLLGILLIFLNVLLRMWWTLRQGMKSMRDAMGGNEHRTAGSQQRTQTGQATSQATGGGKKVFDDNEGEYVDFEEVK